MGYVGEVIVDYWLRVKYPDPPYSIVYQIKPIDYPRRGGPYLDFGVIKDEKVHAVYEVKSQDYIPDKSFVLNPALKAIWGHKNDIASFVNQDGMEFKSASDLKAYLVLLVCPNMDGVKRIGRQNLKQVILFSKVFEDLEKHGRTDYLKYVHGTFDKDIGRVIEILKNPTQGKRIRPEFLRQREACQ
jgi:hypothetical protein